MKQVDTSLPNVSYLMLKPNYTVGQDYPIQLERTHRLIL